MKNHLSPKRIVRKRQAENSSSSLSCYDCSAHNPNCGVDEATVAQGCRACLVFKNVFDNSEYIYVTNHSNNYCIFPQNIQTMLIEDVAHQVVEHPELLETMKVELHIFVEQIYAMELVQKTNLLLKEVCDLVYKYNKKCFIREIESSTNMASSTSPTTSGSTTIASTTVQTAFQCYDCSGPECGKEGSPVSANCPSCIAYRNPDDKSKRLENLKKIHLY